MVCAHIPDLFFVSYTQMSVQVRTNIHALQATKPKKQQKKYMETCNMAAGGKTSQYNPHKP